MSQKPMFSRKLSMKLNWDFHKIMKNVYVKGTGSEIF